MVCMLSTKSDLESYPAHKVLDESFLCLDSYDQLDKTLFALQELLQ